MKDNVVDLFTYRLIREYESGPETFSFDCLNHLPVPTFSEIEFYLDVVPIDAEYV